MAACSATMRRCSRRVSIATRLRVAALAALRREARESLERTLIASSVGEDTTRVAVRELL
eukprot:11185741-Heterocapsa_arctica.AAC.1